MTGAGADVVSTILRAPDLIVRPLWWAVALWLVVALPIALGRVYGGSWVRTSLKAIGLSVLYVFGFVLFGFSFITYMAVITF